MIAEDHNYSMHADARTEMREDEMIPQTVVSRLTELDSGHIYDALLVMNSNRQNYLGNQVANMQATELGDYRPGVSMPRFDRIINERFVQILNVGDHWITVSNVFGETTHDVFVYDSVYRHVNQSTIAQITSLLRDEDRPDIVLHIRKFDLQTNASRHCGFYAVASAYCCWQYIDPTNFIFDETCMAHHLDSCIAKNEVKAFPSIEVADAGESNEIVMRVKKVYCVCQNANERRSAKMIQCSMCKNWYHDICVGIGELDTPIRNRSAVWNGPCCRASHVRVPTIDLR